MDGTDLDPVTATPGATDATLALLSDAAPVVAATDSASAAPNAPSEDKKKGGRPRTAPRDANGKVIRDRKRGRSVAKKRFTQADAVAAPGASAPLTGPVQDGPPPAATARPIPSAEQVAYTAVFAGMAFRGLAAMLARVLKNPDFAPTADEMQAVPEAAARYYLHHNPNGMEDSPGYALLMALGMYYARGSGMLDKMMAQMAPPTDAGNAPG